VFLNKIIIYRREHCCRAYRYVASTEDSSLVPRILRSTDGESLDFVTSSSWHHTSRHVTPEARYDKHDVIADLGAAGKAVIPTPLLVERQAAESWIYIGAQWSVLHQSALINEAGLLAGRLHKILVGEEQREGRGPLNFGMSRDLLLVGKFLFIWG